MHSYLLRVQERVLASETTRVRVEWARAGLTGASETGGDFESASALAPGQSGPLSEQPAHTPRHRREQRRHTTPPTSQIPFTPSHNDGPSTSTSCRVVLFYKHRPLPRYPHRIHPHARLTPPRPLPQLLRPPRARCRPLIFHVHPHLQNQPAHLHDREQDCVEGRAALASL